MLAEASPPYAAVASGPGRHAGGPAKWRCGMVRTHGQVYPYRTLAGGWRGGDVTAAMTIDNNP